MQAITPTTLERDRGAPGRKRAGGAAETQGPRPPLGVLLGGDSDWPSWPDLTLWLLSPVSALREGPGSWRWERRMGLGAGERGGEAAEVGREGVGLDSDCRLYWAPTVRQATGSVPVLPG